MRLGIAAVVLFAISVSAIAQVSGPRAWRQRDVDGQCGYEHGYADSGRTVVIIMQNWQFPPDHLAFGVKNDNWSVKRGDVITEPVTIRSDTFSMSGDVLTLDHRLLVIIPTDTVMKFAASEPKLVVVSRGDKVLTQVGFSGFKAGWESFVSCLTRADAARSDQRRRDERANPDVPVDPFASPTLKPNS